MVAVETNTPAWCYKSICSTSARSGIFPPMADRTKKLRLRRSDRKILQSWLQSRSVPRRQVERAQILLAASEGASSRGIAASVGVARATAQLWVARYEAEGLKGVAEDRPRSGRPREITPEMEGRIIDKTVEEDPPPHVSTHWTSRLLGDALGINHVAVWRVWKKYGLKPQQIRRFKFARDPRLVEKLHDVVGVCLNLPENAAAFSFDEKSGIRAQARSQPGLPLKPGRAGTMPHDHQRHGTTTLLAALEVAAGQVVHGRMPGHRHRELLRFLRRIEREADPDFEIHVILDNYATRTHEKVRRWLERHPRVRLHFVPTGASWLNLVERFFNDIDQRQLKGLAVTSAGQLITAIDGHINRRNEPPQPFFWTRSAQEILAETDAD